jgi:dTMP kinase
VTGTRRAGVLIVVEGIDGAGKTTLVQGLARHWRREGWPVRTFREPTRAARARAARAEARSDPWAAALAFTEGRRRQRPRVFRALRAGSLVLLDRSYLSTLAYNGSALPPRRRRQLAEMQRSATVLPDRVLFLHLPVRAALARLERRATSREVYERAAVLRRAAATYRGLARRRTWLVLDARHGRETLVQEAAAVLRSGLTRRLRRRRQRP